MNFRKLSPVLIAALLVCSCSNPKPAASALHATVALKDGRTVTGSVLSSSVTELRLTGDDNVTQTIPMAQVSSIQYDNGAMAAATPAAQTTPAPQTMPAAAPQAAPMQSAPAPAPAPVAAAPPPQALEPATPAPAPRRQREAQEESEPHVSHYHPPAAAITSKTFTVASGTQIPVRTEETIDSKKAVEGQTFAGEITANIRDSAGAIVIPRGSNATIVIRSASKGGHFKGAPDLVMDLSSLSVDGQEYQVSTVDLSEKGRNGIGANKRTGEYTGGGAIFGTIVGAIAGGGKGALIGAGSGAGAGALTQVLTRGSIKVPVETVLTFQLDRSLEITAAK